MSAILSFGIGPSGLAPSSPKKSVHLQMDSSMRMLEWLRNRLPVRYRSLWTYRRGMSRATRHDHQGALEDYTTVIECKETPSELKAMAEWH